MNLYANGNQVIKHIFASSQKIWKVYKGSSKVWQLNKVNFKDWDSTVLKYEEVVSGNPATAPESPSREGYEFTGWSPSTFSDITSDIDIVAQYTESTLTAVNAVLVTDAKSQTLEYENKAYGYMYHPYDSLTELPVWQTKTSYIFDDESFLSRSLTSNSGTAIGSTTTKTFANGGWSGIALKSLVPTADVLYTKVQLSPYCTVKVEDGGGGIYNQWYWTDVSPQVLSMPPGSGTDVALGIHTYSRGKYFKINMTIADSAGTHTLTKTATSNLALAGWSSGAPSSETLTFDFAPAIINASLKKDAKTTKLEFYESSNNSDWVPMILNACCLYKDTLNQ